MGGTVFAVPKFFGRAVARPSKLFAHSLPSISPFAIRQSPSTLVSAQYALKVSQHCRSIAPQTTHHSPLATRRRSQNTFTPIFVHDRSHQIKSLQGRGLSSVSKAPKTATMGSGSFGCHRCLGLNVPSNLRWQSGCWFPPSSFQNQSPNRSSSRSGMMP